MQDNEELLIQRLLRRLQVEEAHRRELGEANEAMKRQLKRDRLEIERLQKDVLGYRQMAKDEQRESRRLWKRIEDLTREVEALTSENQAVKGVNMQLVINETAASLKSSVLEDIGSIMDEETLRLGNQGNITRFTNFLEVLFQDFSNIQALKAELVSYFEAVDLAYRSKLKQAYRASSLLG